MMHTLKTTLLGMAIACFGLSAFAAEKSNSTPTPADYERFSDTKTLVVLDDVPMSDFNAKIKHAMKEWTVTEVDYITTKTFQARMGDDSYSFLTTTTATYGKDKQRMRYTYLSLLMGKEKVKVTNMPDLISIPLAYAAVEEPNYEYKMPCFVRFILKHVEYMKKHPKEISDTPLMMYNKNTASLAGKTLYLVAEDLEKDMQTIDAIKTVYAHNVKIVSQEELEKAIKEKAKDVVFLHMVAPKKNQIGARCYKMILGADDAEVYYFNYHEMTKKEPNRLLKKDLKKMSKQ